MKALLLMAAATCMAAAAWAQPTGPRPLACTDFDAYINGEWARTTELPADRPRIGSFDVLRRDNDLLLNRALAELMAEPARQTTPGLRHLAAVFKSAMDEEAIQRQGLAALASLLARIDTLERPQLPVLMGELARMGVGQPLPLFVGGRFDDATRNGVFTWAAGLGLPDRDDYSRSDAASQRLREGYRRYVVALAAASGQAVDAAAVDALMAFEAELASAHLTAVQRRDPLALNNPRSRAALAAEAPGFDWSLWLDTWSGGKRFDELNVGQPALAKTMATLAGKAPMPTWRLYLRTRLLDTYAEALSRPFEQAHFNWHQATVRGLQQPRPRGERMLSLIGGPNGSAPMGEALGELYVSKAYSPVARQRALAMVADIRQAMRQRITALPWMSEPTKAAALAKLEAMVAQIGAPERWRSWEALQTRPDDLLGNILRIDAWWLQQRLADLERPVDRTRWNTSANTVNAFAASGNRIVFPAGILQPPFFDERADDASNYGAIGSVIGHEITHHFDDRGRQFDAVGKLRDWWAPQDAAAYKARAGRVAALFSTYEPLPGVRINGQQMLGENISDFGGIHIAFDGLQIALERRRKAGETIPLVDGRTPEQRFFIANAIIWRSKQREAALLNQLRTGQHSPGRWRVLGPLSHQPAFARAFACEKGDAMVADDPILIW